MRPTRGIRVPPWAPREREGVRWHAAASKGYCNKAKGALVAVEAGDVDDVVKIEISNLRYRLSTPTPLWRGV